MTEKVGLVIAVVIATIIATSIGRADDKETLKLLLINGGAIIGQSIACGVAKNRLLKVMTAHAATVEVLSNGDPKIMKLRDDIIKLAADNERHQAVSRCNVIETAFSSFEKTLKDRGLMQ